VPRALNADGEDTFDVGGATGAGDEGGITAGARGDSTKGIRGIGEGRRQRSRRTDDQVDRGQHPDRAVGQRLFGEKDRSGFGDGKVGKTKSERSVACCRWFAGEIAGKPGCHKRADQRRRGDLQFAGDNEASGAKLSRDGADQRRGLSAVRGTPDARAERGRPLLKGGQESTPSACRLPFAVCRLRQSIAPMIQGLNSSSPTPASSLLLCLPEATARISSKISRPSSSRGTPSRTLPALMSMSGSWLW
jgi:hypothetical protein